MNARSLEGVTELLRQWAEGSGAAPDRLFPLVYAELRQLARRCLRREHPNHSIQTGTLVHEAYLRLIASQRLECRDRNHFLAIAGLVMRRLLIEEARRRNRQKRGVGRVPIRLDEAMIVSSQCDQDLIVLDDALQRLERTFPRKCRVVELRYFAGLSIEETAEALGVSQDVVKNEWRTAKVWLRRELETGDAPDGSGKSQAD